MNSQKASYRKRNFLLFRRNLRLARAKWGPQLRLIAEHALRDILKKTQDIDREW